MDSILQGGNDIRKNHRMGGDDVRNKLVRNNPPFVLLILGMDSVGPMGRRKSEWVSELTTNSNLCKVSPHFHGKLCHISKKGDVVGIC